ncbi:hypothetical protein FD755_010127 [Muntiacus reevesi]|uniref:Periphilin-1 n=1 Tax=Muntiacus reevesi TaxID=9886 RepID=A0A5N3XXA2_MUNRE|nr:hypothetical protein FD755_010127 [Muntiacus reevesi]
MVSRRGWCEGEERCYSALQIYNYNQKPVLVLSPVSVVAYQTVTDMRDSFRRKGFYSSHYVRDRSPHKRDTPFFRESPVGRKDSPHSRSGSSVSSRSYSPERSKTYSFHQSQHRKPVRAGACYKRQNEGKPERDKPSRLTEKELAEAASKWAAEKLEKADESNLPEISEYEAGSTAPLFIDHPVEPESNAADGIELFGDSQLTNRSKAIATKTKEIEQNLIFNRLNRLLKESL